MSTQFSARTVIGAVLVVSAVVGAVVWSVASRPREDQTPATVVASMQDVRIDCPGHDPVQYVHADGSGTTTLAALSVPGNTTGIPEFHDCQRLLIDRATTYGPLVGVFARDPNSPVVIGAASGGAGASARAGGTTVSGSAGTPGIAPAIVDSASAIAAGLVPAAEVVDFDRDSYDPLGIKSGFNCLYLVSDLSADYGIGAHMVPVGTNEDACKKPYDASMASTPLLAVPHDPPGDLTEADIPAVARWDWDPVTRRQYIGIRCTVLGMDGAPHAKWCEVGSSAGFGSSPDHHFPIMGHKAKRVWWVKGWYDEQQLAHGSGITIRPLREVGTLVPDELLDDYTDATFPSRSWVHAADVAITPHQSTYTSKLGLDPAVMNRHMNKLAICHGSWAECTATDGGSPVQPTRCSDKADPNWWAKMTSSKGNVKYSCIIRTGHKDVVLAGTARWRWLRGDETIWVRCAEGCCQVNNPGDEL